MLVQLSVCVATFIRLTSCQSTYDVIQTQNDVNSCGRTEHVLSQMMTAVSQLQRSNSELQRSVSQLQRDVAKLTAAEGPNELKGE